MSVLRSARAATSVISNSDEQRRVMVGRVGLRGEVLRAAIQILEPHQRADALVQRMLVADHEERVARGALRQSGILPEVAPPIAAAPLFCTAAAASSR